MDVIEAIKKRRSIRKYRKKDVPIQLVREILEAARWAPSAGNRQAWCVHVVTCDELKKGLVKASGGQDFIAQAPVVLVICADPHTSGQKYSKRGRKLYCIQDATLAAMNMWLTAVELKLGMAWVGAFDGKEVGELLGIWGHREPIIIMPLGYPAEKPKAPERREISQYAQFH